MALLAAGAMLLLALVTRSAAPDVSANATVPAATYAGMSVAPATGCPVTGDLVGDGNPAAGAEALCGSR